MEMRCYRRLLHISYKDHITNEIVCNKIQATIGPYEDILTTVKKRKLRWFEHVIRSIGLCKTIVQGKVPGKEKEKGKRKDGKTTSESGPVSTPTAVREQPKTREGRRLSAFVADVNSAAPMTLMVPGHR